MPQEQRSHVADSFSSLLPSGRDLVKAQTGSGQGMALTTHPHLAPKLEKEWSYTSTSLLGLRGLF
jgi:hypothetical protein